jgi:hypothetical protein
MRRDDVAAAELALLGGILGTLITALSAASIAYFQRRTAIQEEHRLRAFDRHLSAYEQIFTACRSVLDALNDYAAVDGSAADRADPFLRQVLDILRSSAYQYCAAVDWRRSPGMAYLDLPLEKKCLRLRDLLLEWLSRSRLSYGDVATIDRGSGLERISIPEVRRLGVGDYRELRIERRAVVLRAEGDLKLIAEIRKVAAEVVRDLKSVMSH